MANGHSEMLEIYERKKSNNEKANQRTKDIIDFRQLA